MFQLATPEEQGHEYSGRVRIREANLLTVPRTAMAVSAVSEHDRRQSSGGGGYTDPAAEPPVVRRKP